MKRIKMETAAVTTTFSRPQHLNVPADLLERPEAVFVGGCWQAGRGAAAILAIDPSTGEAFARILPASAEQVAEATQAAERAFIDWRRTSGARRADFLRAIAAGLRGRKPDLVALQMLNNGKPRYEAEIDVDDAAATFDYYADLAAELDDQQGRPVLLGDESLTGATYLEPLGPVALVVAWNFPMVTTAWKLAPALAAGCTAVLKPSEFTTLAELVYGDLATQIGLPAGVLNIVPGGGSVGAALCSDRRIRKISFTGSNATGSQVMAAAAGRIVPVSLELGGKSPIIILEDADIAQAVEFASAGIFFNCGQMCSATSRLMVAEGIAEDVTAALVAKTNQLLVAGHDEPDAQMGPLTTTEQFAKVKAVLEKARAAGLDCITGGNPVHDRRGFFVEPSIYRNVPTDHAVWREEIFGPVLAMRSFTSVDEAVALANDTDFGLAATVVGTDGDAAAAVARRLDAGHIWVNTSQMIFPNTAWGGFKASGIGRELGPWGLAAYRGVKHITSAV
ncbi:aldehyde dehydrogenase family protein [Rhizobium croatiense]|uniref:aldehyde dehydrogenase family protein n=1 Tax=Rhizobium croatiense TaxID=2867516 RepID=UPI0023EABEC6|nr:aldehyde dehydrogenase family protein [Rhizobium croatiense]WET73194.1 aldehyde dehydrogenase family protein [Rhizobium croatiense]